MLRWQGANAKMSAPKTPCLGEEQLVGNLKRMDCWADGIGNPVASFEKLPLTGVMN